MKRQLKNIASSKYLVLVDQAVFSGNGFVLNLALARMLGPSQFGVFASLILFIYLFISLSGSLVIQPFQVNYAKVENLKSYAHFAFFCQLVITLIITISAFVLLQLDSFPTLHLHPAGSALLILSFLLHDFFRKIFLSIQQISKALTIDLLHLICQLAALALLWYNGPTLDVVLLTVACSYLPANLVALFLLRPQFNNIMSWQPFLQNHWQEGRWLTLTAGVQWWSNNLFIVSAGVFLGTQTLGALRLVQSMFGVLNVLLQAFENYALPQAVRLYQTSVEKSKLFIRGLSLKTGVAFAAILLILFLFSDNIIALAGGPAFSGYGYVVKGMVILYLLIFLGYPIRITIRMMVLNKSFFVGYVLAFGFSLLSYQLLLEHWLIWGALAGLITNQLIMLSYWKYTLIKKQLAL